MRSARLAYNYPAAWQALIFLVVTDVRICAPRITSATMSEEASKVEVTETTEAAEQTEKTSDEEKVEEKSEEQPQQQESGEGDAGTEGDGAQAEGGEAEKELEVKEKPQEEEKPQLSDPEEPEDDVPIVLATGASGFLATHIIKQLLEQDRFRVRGTVRSLGNEKKVKPLRELVADPKYPLRLIEADLLNPKSWIVAVRRCSYVFHVASPLDAKGSKIPT